MISAYLLFFFPFIFIIGAMYVGGKADSYWDYNVWDWGVCVSLLPLSGLNSDKAPSLRMADNVMCSLTLVEA